MAKKFPTPVISDQAIAEAFSGTNFGTVGFRKLLEQGVLSVTCGYRTGYTLECILRKLGLVTPKGRVTAKGKALLMEAFYDASHGG